MTSMFAGSVLLHALAAIGDFWRSMVADSRVVAAARNCALARLIRKWLDAPCPMDGTLSYAVAKRGGAAWLDGAVSGSVLARIWGVLCRLAAGSRIFAWLFAGGVTEILLTVLGLYAGVDWLLRDVLAVPVLSSLWDELLMVFCAMWLLREKSRPQTIAEPRTTVLGYFILFFLAIGVFLIGMVSPFLSVSIAGYRAECQYLLWYFIVIRLLRDDRDAKRLYATFLVIAILIALHGVYQYIVAVPIPSNWTDEAEQSVRTRVFSIFSSPNIMADYMVLFAPMCAALAYHAKKTSHKLLAWCAAGVLCVACLFTMSRGGWMAMAVAIVVFALLIDRRLLALLVVAGVCSLSLPFVASRLGYLFTDAFVESTNRAGRSARWVIGLDYLKNSSPLFGYGLGMFGGAVAMQNRVYEHVYYFYLDNYYIKTLVEMGCVGLVSFILMLVSLLATGLRSLYRCAKQKTSSVYAPTAGIFAGLCGVLTHCYFENIFEEPYMMAVFWILAALMTYLGTFRKETA